MAKKKPMTAAERDRECREHADVDVIHAEVAVIHAEVAVIHAEVAVIHTDVISWTSPASTNKSVPKVLYLSD